MKNKIKIVFVAHPVGGDVKENIEKILEICKKIHTDEIIPFTPYVSSLLYLKDENEEERNKGIAASFVHFHRKSFDELWLFGDSISKGMEGEVKLARELGIIVVAKTKGTKRDLAKLI